MAKISRASYADMYGPTTGDKIRLADTALFDRLQIASNNGKSQLVILSGAAGGIDALSAAKS